MRPPRSSVPRRSSDLDPDRRADARARAAPGRDPAQRLGHLYIYRPGRGRPRARRGHLRRRADPALGARGIPGSRRWRSASRTESRAAPIATSSTPPLAGGSDRLASAPPIASARRPRACASSPRPASSDSLFLAGRALPSLLVVDSIQVIRSDAASFDAGSAHQIRLCVAALARFAKQTKVPILIIGHVNKEGEMAGPETLRHLVDVVLYLEAARMGQRAAALPVDVQEPPRRDLGDRRPRDDGQGPRRRAKRRQRGSSRAHDPRAGLDPRPSYSASASRWSRSRRWWGPCARVSRPARSTPPARPPRARPTHPCHPRAPRGDRRD